MLIFPAIDLYEKQAVRLFKGDYAQKTVYSSTPLSVAKDFEAAGATCAHIVDLEGAKTGGTPNFEVIAEIKKGTHLFMEVGGGIRSMEVIKRYLDAGLDRVILGTAAVEDPAFLAKAVDRYGQKIAVGVDIKDGYVAVKGWTQKSALNVYQMCDSLQEIGVSTVICTDISLDGAMRGSNRKLYSELSQKYGMRFIASGGVSTLDDVRELRALSLYGAIVGKAYYEKAINLSQAIEVAK